MQWMFMNGDEREVAYSPSTSLPDGDYRPLVAEYVERSNAAYARCQADGPPVIEVSYGTAASQTVDVVVPRGDGPAPVLVFIHGGYWQELSKRESFFAAIDVLEQGWAYAAVDYTLAPAASLAEIVDECVAAIVQLEAQADVLGIDPAQIVVSGSSAGAHLAAMVAARRPSSGPAAVPLAGLVLLSGVYELEALIGTGINEAVGIDATVAAKLSPIRLAVDGFPSTRVLWGQHEPGEFKAQGQAFADHLAQAGIEVSVDEIEGRNHFDVVFDIAHLAQLLVSDTGRNF